ncbi:hypothetical protein Pelo_18691 [Pelomyxa schiedti]|nr:hypothetical protein Pelo_18691 [Pelomyxa schiedti]
MLACNRPVSAPVLFSTSTDDPHITKPNWNPQVFSEDIPASTSYFRFSLGSLLAREAVRSPFSPQFLTSCLESALSHLINSISIFMLIKLYYYIYIVCHSGSCQD